MKSYQDKIAQRLAEIVLEAFEYSLLPREDVQHIAGRIKRKLSVGLSDLEVANFVDQLATDWPIFRPILDEPVYRDFDVPGAIWEQATINYIASNPTATIRPESGRPSYEYREFSRKIAPGPLVVRVDQKSILYAQAELSAELLKSELEDQGWEPDEPIRSADLRQNDRVKITPRGRRNCAGETVTIRFRRRS